MQFQAHTQVQTSFLAKQLLDASANLEAAESAAELRCCGWFDSSYKLSAGLLVIEDVKSSFCFCD